MVTPEVAKQVNSMLMKDLRTELRARGLNPAGGLEALRERLIESMDNNLNPTPVSSLPSAAEHGDKTGNNYGRPNGQNVGNFITDRPSSRVLSHPGGKSQISFGWDEPAKIESSHVQVVAKDIPASVNAVETNENLDTNMHTANNYGRPNGQNVDNFLTDRPSSKVLAPPGGQDHVNSLNLGREVPNSGNNYSRPNGQNSGNFITDRPSSRVLQAPGGASQIMFG